MTENWIQVRYSDRSALLMSIRIDLKRVARLEDLEKNQAPTRTFYLEHGRFPAHAVTSKILEVPSGHGSWLKAMEKIGLEPVRRFTTKDISYNDIVLALDRVRRKLELPVGIAPSFRRYKRWSKQLQLPTTYMVLRVAGTGSWIEAMKHYNLERAE